MKIKTSKNGKIELARFVFAIIIMLFHIGFDVLPSDFRIWGNITFFRLGWFAVEFFFVVSGFLMASSAFKQQEKSLCLGKDTYHFLYKKIMAILPYHIIVFAVSYVFLLIVKTKSFKSFWAVFFEAIPNFFLIQRSGLENLDVLGVEWYISEMLIAMLVLYPLCVKYYERFTRIVAPALAIFIIGYLTKTTGGLNGSTSWSVLFSKTFLRAFSEICAGIFTFEFCRNLKRLNFSKADKVFLTILECFSYFMVVFFICYDFPRSYGGTFFIFVCLAVCLSFSGVTYGNEHFNNKVIYYLGSLSLPLYLCQSFSRVFAKYCARFMEPHFAIMIFFACTFTYALVVTPIAKKLMIAINKKAASLTSKLQ